MQPSLGFWRHDKFYYTPGWHESGTSLELFVNAKKWDSLEDDLKAIVEQCANSTNVVMLSEFQLRSGPVLQQFINQHGVIIKTLSDDVLTKLGEITGDVISELIAKDKLSAKVFKSMAKVRTEQIAYTDVTEASFIQARKLKYKFPS